MKNQRGFAHLTLLLVLLLVAVGGVGYWVWYNHNQNNSTYLAPAGNNSPAPPVTTTKPADPYEGWKTYTSNLEKASFKYPADWHVEKTGTGFDNKGDSIKLTSPSATFYISWSSSIGGLGGACDNKHKPPYEDSHGIHACPYFTVLDKQKISGADLYYVAGIVTTDGKTFRQWMALQGKADDLDSLTKSGSYIGFLVFKCKNNDVACSLNSGDLVGGTGFKATTKDKAEAFFSTKDAKQAKLILTSFSY